MLIAFEPDDMKLEPLSRRSRIPSSAHYLLDHNIIQLGHHTTSAILPAIMSNGVQPHDITGVKIDDNLPTRPGCVYLSSRLDTHYFTRATQAFGGSGIVVVVRVSILDLLPDPNCFPPEYLRSNTADLHRSLLGGQCIHKGTISTDKIFAVVDAAGNRIR